MDAIGLWDLESFYGQEIGFANEHVTFKVDLDYLVTWTTCMTEFSELL